MLDIKIQSKFVRAYPTELRALQNKKEREQNILLDIQHARRRSLH